MKDFFKKAMRLGILLLLVSPHTRAQLSAEQDAAKLHGIALYNQHKAVSAMPFPKTAAEGGDAEARYYLAEAIRKNTRYIDAAAREAYEASAEQGNIYAMIRLGEMDSDLCVAMNNCSKSRRTPQEWIATAKSTALAQASKHDAESMYLLYELTGEKTWLEQSAENGFALSQYLLATEYREGNGFFITPSRRADAVERWMKASAEGGYPRAMTSLTAVLFEKNDLEGARNWSERAASTGYVEAVFNYAYYLSGENTDFGFPVNLVRSYALLSLFSELDGGGGAKEDADYLIAKFRSSMSPAQLDEAGKMASQWKENHPALSYFPFKLSR